MIDIKTFDSTEKKAFKSIKRLIIFEVVHEKAWPITQPSLCRNISLRYDEFPVENIQLTTWGDNKELEYTRRKNGKNNKVNKAVLKYSKQGVFIEEYYSLAEAGRDNKLSVGNIFCVLSPNYNRKQQVVTSGSINIKI